MHNFFMIMRGNPLRQRKEKFVPGRHWVANNQILLHFILFKKKKEGKRLQITSCIDIDVLFKWIPPIGIVIFSNRICNIRNVSILKSSLTVSSIEVIHIQFKSLSEPFVTFTYQSVSMPKEHFDSIIRAVVGFQTWNASTKPSTMLILYFVYN